MMEAKYLHVMMTISRMSLHEGKQNNGLPQPHHEE